MSTRLRFMIANCAVALALTPLATFAQTITVQVNTCAPMTGSGTVNIATTCGSVTISNAPGATARVRALSDGTTDRLVLENAVVTTSAPVTNFPITFSAPLAALPSAPPDAWYYAEGTGSLPGSGSITFQGWLNPTGTWDQVGVNDSFTAGTLHSFSPSSGFTTNQSYSNMNNPRSVKGAVSFTLNNTSDQLLITSLLVRNGAKPDSAEEKTEVCSKVQCDKCIPRSTQGFMCRQFNVGCEPCVKDDADCPE